MLIGAPYHVKASRLKPEARQASILRVNASTLLKALVATILVGSVWRELVGNENVIAILGYQITLVEPMLSILLLLNLANFSSGRFPKTLLSISALLFFLIFALSLFRGTALDPQRALFFARPYIIISLVLLAASSFKLRYWDQREIINLIFYFGVILSSICYFRVITGIGGYEAHGRPLLVWATFIILAAFSVTMIYKNEIGFRRYYFFFGLAFAGAILGSGQGTALVAAILIILLIVATGRGGLLPPAVRIPILMLGLLAVLLSGPVVMGEISDRSILSGWAEERGDTSRGRQLVWRSFLEAFDARIFFDRLFGLPMGQKDILIVDLQGDRIWTHSLHNAYLEVLAFSGYAGFTVFVICVLAVTLGGLRLFFQPTDRRMAITAASFVIMMLTFGISYDFRADAAFHLLMPILLVRASYLHSRHGQDGRRLVLVRRARGYL
jgi:hypothetical protein